jgi:AraC family transcriptional regulator
MRDPLLAEICRRLEDDPPANAVVREWTYGMIFAALVRLAGRRRAERHPSILTPRSLERVLAAIDADLGERLPIEHLAEIAGMPKRNFTSAFREATGLPVHQFVLRRRADRAVELLVDGDLPLADIAQLSGFAHQAHMNRVVTRLKGPVSRVAARYRAPAPSSCG